VNSERERQPIPRDRDDRLFDAARRLEENLQVELASNRAYERWRQVARDTTGRRLGGPIKPYEPPALPQGAINVSDPDSRVMRTQGTPPRQAYNAQTAVNDRQIILAAEVTVDAPDFGHLEPMLETTLRGLCQQGVTAAPDTVIADAGYWHTAQMQAITDRGIEVLVPPDGNKRDGKRRAGRTASTTSCAASCPPSVAASSTHNARSLSSRSTDRSNTTAGSTGSCKEAEPLRSQSGGWRQRPTTSSSSTPARSRTPPDTTTAGRKTRFRGNASAGWVPAHYAFSDSLSPKRSPLKRQRRGGGDRRRHRP
jgi:hypothetical protein